MTDEERSERLAVRMTPTEAEMLKALADADGLTSSDVIRLSVRRAYAARFGEGLPKPKKGAARK